MMKGLIIKQQTVADENMSMSNITSASGEASLSSGNRLENGSFNFNPQSDQQYYPPPNQTQPVKKKRNQPGNPDPDAEVVAMSPKSLLATNRFVCEICSKGFQRDQNLQLHRRGHNLPWKLKKRSSKEVRKKVYVCPETSCVHHHPSRALGDLTGIKKHFCRKHGEKKWKCSKCSKRYAVQSDWKVHYKICGTREYRCDCGTLFSRRDSFITHRAFCDARAILGGNSALSTQAGTSASYIDLPIPPQFISGHDHICALKKEHTSFNLRPDIPPWLASHGPPPIDLTSSIFTTPTRLNQEFPQNNQDSTVLCNEDSNPNPSTSGPTTTHSSAHQRPIFSPHLPATALLRKAVHMGAANMSSKNSFSSSSSSVPLAAEKLMSPHKEEAHVSDDSGNYMNSSTTGFGLNLSPCEEVMASSTTGFVQSLASCGNKAGALTDYASPTTAGTDTAGAAIAPPPLLESQDMVTCFPSTIRSAGLATIFGDGFNDDLLSSKKYILSNRSIQQHFSMADQGGGSDGMTSDFLGLTTISHGGVTGVMNIAGTFGNRMNTSNEHQN